MISVSADDNAKQQHRRVTVKIAVNRGIGEKSGKAATLVLTTSDL